MSQQKLSAELLRLGCSKWKSCGLIRYRDLQLRRFEGHVCIAGAAAGLHDLLDVIRPPMQGLALLVSVVVEIIGTVADALWLMVLHGIPDLARDAECRHSGLDSGPQVLRREGWAAQPPAFKQSRNCLPQRIFAEDAILRRVRGKKWPALAVVGCSGEKSSGKRNKRD